MAVKLRLMRMGKKKHPTYRVVAADSRSPRDGRIIELIGRYDPHPHPSVVEINNERALHWLTVGAQPTAAVRKLLEISGAWGQFRVARGDVHVVGEVAPPPEKEKLSKKAKARAAEEADATPDEPAAGEAEAAPEESAAAAADAEAPAEEAAAEAPAVEAPATEEPAEATVEDAVAEDSAPDAAVEEPAPEEPADDDFVAEAAAAEEPVAETEAEASESDDAAEEKA